MLTSLTVATSIAASPEVVLRFVADPQNLPLWAPAAVGLRLEVRTSHELGTVDFLAADAPPDRPFGAYSRVVRNGAGSEYLFTRFVSRELREEDVARARAVLVEELAAVRTCCEGKERAPDRICTSPGPAPPSRRPTAC